MWVTVHVKARACFLSSRFWVTCKGGSGGVGGLEDFRMKYGIRTLMMGKELIGTGGGGQSLLWILVKWGPSLILETISTVLCFQGTPRGIGGAQSTTWLCYRTTLGSTLPCPAVVLRTQVLEGCEARPPLHLSQALSQQSKRGLP